MNPYALAAKWGGLVLLVLSLVAGGWWLGSRAGAAEVAALRADHAEQQARAAERLATLATDYRNREREMGETFIAATARHAKDLTRAQTERDRLVDDLRTGARRLQDRWAGCVSASAQAPGRAGAPDAAADDRRRSAGRIVAAADACAADVIALQSILSAERASVSP
jgi:hypothetical protein